MKKYVMNKNVEHNGKPYPKGTEIKESDDGFKNLVQAGHADELEVSGAKAESEPSEQPEQPEKSEKSGKPSKR